MVGTTRKYNPLEARVNQAEPEEGQRAQSQDVVMSIKVEHLHNIAEGVKNHEFRKYLLPK